MMNQDKHQALTKKLNEYTGHVTPGQMTKLSRNEIKHGFNVYLGRDPHTGGMDKVDEYAVYENHPDNKQMTKDLSLMKSHSDAQAKTQEALTKQDQGAGQGGPSDSIPNFASSIAQGASQLGQRINISMPRTSLPTPQQSFPGISGITGKGMRTDRNNNPTAMTTDVAATAGLRPGIDYVKGDPFKGGDGHVYYTAKLLGNPLQTTIKAIDNMGFYTQSGKPRWTYTNQIAGINQWKNLNASQKVAIVKQMYHHEGGSGKLLQGTGGPADGWGGPRDLGNITTGFGDQTKDTSFHRGIDIANANGTPIPKLTGTGGVVTKTGPASNPDYGNQVIIKNDNGMTESYSHLNRAAVRPGQRVGPNQQIGEMGATGNSWSSTGGDPSHLHYELSDAYGRLVNPINYT
jgi:murein DD-endopeptidase MepM/ murein hydrolase activator NlpD